MPVHLNENRHILDTLVMEVLNLAPPVQTVFLDYYSTRRMLSTTKQALWRTTRVGSH